MQSTQVGTRLFFTSPEKTRERDTAKSATVSTLFHLLVIAALWFVSEAGFKAVASQRGAGSGLGVGAAGGGGGGREEQVSMLIPVPAPAPPEPPLLAVPQKIEDIEPPQPATPLEPVVAKVDSVPPQSTPAPRAASGSGAGEGQGIGTGSGAGTGAGTGGGSGGGSGGGIGSGVGPGTGRGRIIAPSPEVLLIPPQAPGSVRGRTVTVRLAVDSVGVVRSAEIIPSTGDRKYDASLRRVALGWKFRPATDASNRPVSVSFDVQFTF